MRHQWVKRAMALLLAAMVFSLTACGGSSSSSSSDSDSDSEEEETEEEEEAEAEEEEDDYIVEEGISVDIEAVTLVDSDDCSIMVTGLSLGDTNKYGSVLPATLTVEIENKTEDTDLTFNEGYVCINDVMRTLYCPDDMTVEAGETAEIHYYINSSSIDIGDLTDIYFVLEGWYYAESLEESLMEEDERLVVTGSAHIYPDGEENAVSYEREAQDTDIVLCEEDGVTILYIGGEDDYDGEDWDGYTLNYYAVNSSDLDVSFEVTPVAVNGTEIDVTGWEASNLALLAGKVRYTGYLMFDDYQLADLDLTDSSEIETVDVQIVIYDLETEEEFYTTTVTITVN